MLYIYFKAMTGSWYLFMAVKGTEQDIPQLEASWPNKLVTTVQL